jgi:hypothetical protein
MPGGPRVRSGPPRDPNALRRGRDRDGGGFELLPASGRDGETPPWPFGRSTKFERERWEQVWKMPQAIMWERLSMEIPVAIYVRSLAEASKPGAAATKTNNLLRQIDSLGISPGGLAANRWRIVDDGPSVSRTPARPKTATAKDRLRVLEGGSDARAS